MYDSPKKFKKLMAFFEDEYRQASPRRFEFRIWSQSNQLEKCVDKLMGRYLRATTAKRVSKDKYRTTLKVILCNLAIGELGKQYIELGRHSRFFPKAAGRNPSQLKRDPVVNIVDWLKAELLIKDIAKKPRRVKPKGKPARVIRDVSVVKATSTLWEWLELNLGTIKFEPHPSSEFIVLRRLNSATKTKESISFEDSEETTRMRSILFKWNTLMANTTINVDEKFVFGRFHTRIFNDDFTKGGRFYRGPLDGFKRSQRKTIRFSDTPTVELDFRCLHGCMAYNSLGLPLVGDAYLIDGYPKKLREVFKKSFNKMLNASSIEIATKAILGFLNENRGRYPEVDATEVVDAVLARHKPIQHLFFTGYGLILQRKDSDIAEKIIERFTDMNKPILCLHDSFIVCDHDESLLRAEMLHQYSALFSGFTITVDYAHKK